MKSRLKFREWNGLEMNYEPMISMISTASINDRFDDNDIMQFIGLVDKNAIEIYEGDYLIDRFPIDEEDLSKGYNESLLPVVWCDKQLMWCVDASFKKDGGYLTSLV